MSPHAHCTHRAPLNLRGDAAKRKGRDPLTTGPPHLLGGGGEGQTVATLSAWLRGLLVAAAVILFHPQHPNFLLFCHLWRGSRPSSPTCLPVCPPARPPAWPGWPVGHPPFFFLPFQFFFGHFDWVPLPHQPRPPIGTREDNVTKPTYARGWGRSPTVFLFSQGGPDDDDDKDDDDPRH